MWLCLPRKFYGWCVLYEILVSHGSVKRQMSNSWYNDIGWSYPCKFHVVDGNGLVRFRFYFCTLVEQAFDVLNILYQRIFPIIRLATIQCMPRICGRALGLDYKHYVSWSAVGARIPFFCMVKISLGPGKMTVVPLWRRKKWGSLEPSWPQIGTSFGDRFRTQSQIELISKIRIELVTILTHYLLYNYVLPF